MCFFFCFCSHILNILSTNSFYTLLLRSHSYCDNYNCRDTKKSSNGTNSNRVQQTCWPYVLTTHTHTQTNPLRVIISVEKVVKRFLVSFLPVSIYSLVVRYANGSHFCGAHDRWQISYNHNNNNKIDLRHPVMGLNFTKKKKKIITPHNIPHL